MRTHSTFRLLLLLTRSRSHSPQARLAGNTLPCRDRLTTRTGDYTTCQVHHHSRHAHPHATDEHDLPPTSTIRTLALHLQNMPRNTTTPLSQAGNAYYYWAHAISASGSLEILLHGLLLPTCSETMDGRQVHSFFCNATMAPDNIIHESLAAKAMSHSSQRATLGPEAHGLNKKKLTHMGLFTETEIVVGAYILHEQALAAFGSWNLIQTTQHLHRPHMSMNMVNWNYRCSPPTCK